MTPAEIAEFLEAERTITVATINADGTPHLTAMWFGVNEAGDVEFWTYRKSQKIVNLRRDPRLTVMAESGDSYDQLRGVSISGRAAIIEDHEQVIEFGMRVNDRYWGDSPDPAAMREAVEVIGAKRVLVVVRPEKVASWDHRKLGGGY